MQQLVDPDALEQMIEDTEGVPVVVGAISTWGHLEEPHEVVLTDGQVVVYDRSVVVASGKLPDLRIGDAISVDGTDYTVRERRRIEDGALMTVALTGGND